MNPSLCTMACLLAAFAVGPARADDADFAKAKKCGSCHAVDEKLVGPSFKSVAAKYADQKDAERAATEARLAKKIREGGAGVWGVVPMPANPEVNAEDAKRLVRYVLTQK